MLIAHYAIRALMHTVAVRLELPTDRLSFVHSLRTLCDRNIHLVFMARRQWPQVIQRVLLIRASGAPSTSQSGRAPVGKTENVALSAQAARGSIRAATDRTVRRILCDSLDGDTRYRAFQCLSQQYCA